jgi:hypothetical protein
MSRASPPTASISCADAHFSVPEHSGLTATPRIGLIKAMAEQSDEKSNQRCIYRFNVIKNGYFLAKQISLFEMHSNSMKQGRKKVPIYNYLRNLMNDTAHRNERNRTLMLAPDQQGPPRPSNLMEWGSWGYYSGARRRGNRQRAPKLHLQST